MKQLICSLRTGMVEVIETPVPICGEKDILISVKYSLVSPGTENMLVEFGKSSLLQKARQQPERVEQVLKKIKNDGLIPTVNAVTSKLDKPCALGYSAVGTVVDVGSGVKGFSVGDVVVSNGPHADYVAVNQNLVVKVPDGLDLKTASFSILGAISLQSIRLSEPTFGEKFVVFGLGLIGRLTCLLLKANGCEVLGVEIDPSVREVAEELGIRTIPFDNKLIEVSVESISSGLGVDGVILAYQSNDSEGLKIASEILRPRGRVVLLGVMPIELDRSPLYRKEITFQVSCSYGPGRYDKSYAEDGVDFPFGLVRWTAKRNIAAFVSWLKEESLDLSSWIDQEIPIEEARKAYEIQSVANGLKKQMGATLFKYGGTNCVEQKVISTSGIERFRSTTSPKMGPSSNNEIFVDFIGPGSHAVRNLLPYFAKSKNVTLNSICSKNGLSAAYYGRRFRFLRAIPSFEKSLEDSTTDLLVVSTPHNSHAHTVIRAIECNKKLFIEKPLCLNLDELESIKAAVDGYRNSFGYDPYLYVNFNRRFSQPVIKARALIKNISSPISITYHVNAPPIPSESWIMSAEGGGYVKGECCHFIDLAIFLAGSNVVDSNIDLIGDIRTGVAISLRFENGSRADIRYFLGGPSRMPKESISIITKRLNIDIVNFKKIVTLRDGNKKVDRYFVQDKGMKESVNKVIDSCIQDQGLSPIALHEIFLSSEISIKLGDRIATHS